jgi:hypothetical protein
MAGRARKFRTLPPVGGCWAFAWLAGRVPRASLRTLGAAFWPAWKVARLRDHSARRRVWGLDRQSGATSESRGRRLGWKDLAHLGRQRRASQRNSISREEAGKSPAVPVYLPGPLPRRRAEWSFGLATFHAGAAASIRVRRDTCNGRDGDTRHKRLSQTRSAGRMASLCPDRLGASGEARDHEPSVTNQPTHHRRRPTANIERRTKRIGAPKGPDAST